MPALCHREKWANKIRLALKRYNQKVRLAFRPSPNAAPATPKTTGAATEGTQKSCLKSLWKPVSPPATTSATTAASARIRTATTYKVFVTLIGKELDEAGLLLDFKLLKQVMRPVVDYLDHQMINDLKPFDEINPSARTWPRYFFQQTREQLHAMTSGRASASRTAPSTRPTPASPATTSNPCI